MRVSPKPRRSAPDDQLGSDLQLGHEGFVDHGLKDSAKSIPVQLQGLPARPCLKYRRQLRGRQVKGMEGGFLKTSCFN